MGTLSGNVAVISGALGDIGRAIALELAQRGADVALSDIRPEADAAELCERINAIGVRCGYQPVDVSDAAAIQTWVDLVEATFGLPTFIIPNAAIVTVASSVAITPDQWARELTVNLNGAFHLAAAGARRLRERNAKGRIVFIGSWAAHAPHVSLPAYCAAKAGVRALCRCMALELAPHGILVNEVAPGFVDAGLSAAIMRADPGSRERLRAVVPNGTLIEPEEVARQVADLCEPGNRHIVGATLLMDGGLSLLSTTDNAHA